MGLKNIGKKFENSSFHRFTYIQNYHGQFCPVTIDGESRSLSMVTHASKHLLHSISTTID